MNIVIGVIRSLGLHCPHCHQGRLMKNWFVLNPACSQCGYVFMKESGDFWGGMVFSYTYAGVIAMSIAALLVFFDWLTWGHRVYAAAFGGLASIILLHPFTRANWIAIMFHTRGQYEDYRPPKERA